MNTQFINNDNGQIAYEESGSGPLVICIPGMGDLRAEYRFLAPHLVQAGFHTACMDVRGHGESSTKWNDYSVAGVGSDALALIRQLNQGPAFIIGTSMAAGAAVWAAVEAPEMVRGVVLISPFVRGESQWAINLLYSLMFARPWGASIWAAFYTRLYPSQKPPDFKQYRALIKANMSLPGRLEALKYMISASKSASEKRLPAFKSKALVLMGSKDPDFKNPETEAGWLASHLNARYEMVANAGHYPHAEMPEDTTPRILTFLTAAMTA